MAPSSAVGAWKCPWVLPRWPRIVRLWCRTDLSASALSGYGATKPTVHKMPWLQMSEIFSFIVVTAITRADETRVTTSSHMGLVMACDWRLRKQDGIGSHYIWKVFQDVSDSAAGFGSPPGLKYRPLEHHDCQLKEEISQLASMWRKISYSVKKNSN